ncbi:MAG TPA: hypothetical protein VFS44_06720 [Gemmatimonadaceae bacterium]|nr:hypothetical protein [Gemmatimonadaceae bacterium]
MTRGRLSLGCAVLAAALWGCNKGSAAPAAAADSGAATMAAPRANVPDRAEIARTVAEVTADVNRIAAAPAATQRRLLPAHERAVTGMLTRFEDRVRAMHVTVDPDWVAVIDSVRSDLGAMPTMSDADLHAYMPGHVKRVMRIVACVDMVRA